MAPNKYKYTPLSDEQGELVLALCEAGKGQNEIARLTGLSNRRVTGYLRDQGIQSDTSKTAAAVQKNKETAAEKRSAFREELFDNARRINRRMVEEYVYYTRQDGSLIKVTLPEPPLRELQGPATAIASLLSGEKQIGESIGDPTSNEQKTMLDNLFVQFQVTAAELIERGDVE